MGRNRKPTRTEKLEGNVGHKTYAQMNPHEPMPDDVPDNEKCPDWLIDEGITLWHSLGATLRSQGLLTVADLETFNILCNEYDTYRKACVILNEGGFEENKTFIGVRNKALGNFERLGGQFGLTPSTRSRIISMDPAKKSALDKFLDSELG